MNEQLRQEIEQNAEDFTLYYSILGWTLHRSGEEVSTAINPSEVNWVIQRILLASL